MQKIFYQGNKRKQVPSNASITKLESFFGCAATLMTHQLQHLLLHSIQDFTDLIVQPAVSSLSHTTSIVYPCTYNLFPAYFASFEKKKKK